MYINVHLLTQHLNNILRHIKAVATSTYEVHIFLNCMKIGLLVLFWHTGKFNFLIFFYFQTMAPIITTQVYYAT